MNTAACLISEPDVFSPEPAIAPESAEPEVPEVPSPPPPREDISLKVPSGRDMEVYEDVEFAGMTQRQAAKKHGISQPRVHQILQEMAAWMADNTPGVAAGLTRPQQLRLAYHTVTMQLRYHFEFLMGAWQNSQGLETVRRTTIVNGIRRTHEVERPSSGNPRYVREAGRVSLALFKLAGGQAGMEIAAAPQNSPYWEAEAQESGRGQESAKQESAEGGLSTFAERARNPNLTREEMDAITAEQEAVYEATKAKLERFERADRDMKNTLSLGSGPLLPEDGERSERVDTRRPRSGEDGCSHAERGNKSKRRDRRRDFLRGEPAVMTIRELIEPAPPTGT
ncbi:MAG: hypothetical protein ACR2FY_08520 [Pirellulaceae bacterium]